MATVQRWVAAQDYERNFWADASSKIARGARSQFDWYRWRAEQLEQRLSALELGHLASGNATVLEVGCGPVGIVSYFPGRVRIAVDPLNSFYGTDPVLSATRSPGVDYRTGLGESVPCETGSCDLVIIENCIDHVQDIHSVGRELNRVLRPGGVLYLNVNCRTAAGYYVHRAMSRLRIDTGHPHTFTPDRAVAFVRRHGFEPLGSEAASAWTAHLNDLGAPSLRARLKALSGVSEYVFKVYARKEREAWDGPLGHPK
jgi:SAM-dependent methyltransferase